METYLFPLFLPPVFGFVRVVVHGFGNYLDVIRIVILGREQIAYTQPIVFPGFQIAIMYR